MNIAEANEILWDAPKDSLLEPAVFDRIVHMLKVGADLGGVVRIVGDELLLGGGMGADGHPIPFIRYSRGS